MICSLLKVVKRQFFSLKSSDIASTYIVSDFQDLQSKILHASGSKEVVWADQSSLEGSSNLTVSEDTSKQVTDESVLSDSLTRSDFSCLLDFPSITTKTPLCKYCAFCSKISICLQDTYDVRVFLVVT